MERQEPKDEDWDRIARVFFKAPAPLSGRDADILTAKVMARVRELERPVPFWLAPALGFGLAAAGLFVFWPERVEALDVRFLTGGQSLTGSGDIVADYLGDI